MYFERYSGIRFVGNSTVTLIAMLPANMEEQLTLMTILTLYLMENQL